MAGLNAIAKSKPAADTGLSSDRPPVAVPIRSRPIKPRKRLPLGRQLAFCIDDDGVQMAAASHGLGGTVLHAAQKVYLAASARAEKPRRDFIARAIQDFISEYGGQRADVAITLSGRGTAFRSIVLPELRKRELTAAVGFEAKRQIPFPSEESRYGFRPVERISQGKDRRLGISLCAATHEAVDLAMAPVLAAGAQIQRVYFSADLLGQLLGRLTDFDANGHYALIDVQVNCTEISFYRGSELVFYHINSVGSSFLQDRLGPTVFEYFAESLATEIQNSLDFYSGQFAAPQVNAVYIYGDLAYTEELMHFLADRFGLNFLRFPVEQLNLSGLAGALPDSAAVCLPAIAACCNRAQLANLLPENHRLRLRRRRMDRFALAALIAAAALAAGHWIQSSVSLQVTEKHLAELQGQVQSLRQSDAYRTYEQLKRQIEGNRLFISKSQVPESFFGLYLKDLSRLTPSPVQVYYLEHHNQPTGRNLLLSGVIRTESTPPEVVLAEFVENLSASSLFDSVLIERHGKRRQPGGFELDFHLSMRALP